METNTTRSARRGETHFHAGRFRAQMVKAGITQVKLAEASGVPQPAISALLNARAYAGPSRVGRLQDALHQLSQQVAQAAEPAEIAGDPEPKPEARIKRL